MREPEAMEFLGPIPSVWDDTRALDGKISEYIVVARRNGNDWYVGAMSDWTARDLDLDFSFLPDGNFSVDAYQDGTNADRQASDYKLVKLQVNKTTRLKIHLAPAAAGSAPSSAISKGCHPDRSSASRSESNCEMEGPAVNCVNRAYELMKIVRPNINRTNLSKRTQSPSPKSHSPDSAVCLQ